MPARIRAAFSWLPDTAIWIPYLILRLTASCRQFMDMATIFRSLRAIQAGVRPMYQGNQRDDPRLAPQATAPTLRKEKEVAEMLGVSVFTLRRERQSGRIAHTMVRGRCRYTAAHIEDYLKSNEVLPCRNVQSDTKAKSPGTGFRSAPTVRCGTAPGSTLAQDKLVEHRSALMILQPRSSNSPVGSQEMWQQNKPICRK